MRAALVSQSGQATCCLSRVLFIKKRVYSFIVKDEKMPKPRTPKLLSLKDNRVTNSDSNKARADKMKRYRLKKKKKGTDKKKDNPLGQPSQHQQQLASTTMFFHYNQSLGPPFY